MPTHTAVSHSWANFGRPNPATRTTAVYKFCLTLCNPNPRVQSVYGRTIAPRTSRNRLICLPLLPFLLSAAPACARVPSFPPPAQPERRALCRLRTTLSIRAAKLDASHAKIEPAARRCRGCRLPGGTANQSLFLYRCRVRAKNACARPPLTLVRNADETSKPKELVDPTARIQTLANQKYNATQ